jgi:hypothetical protein
VIKMRQYTIFLFHALFKKKYGELYT